jgi:hypothetical protein
MALFDHRQRGRQTQMLDETPEFAPADPMPPEIKALRDSTEPVWIFAYGSRSGGCHPRRLSQRKSGMLRTCLKSPSRQSSTATDCFRNRLTVQLWAWERVFVPLCRHFSPLVAAVPSPIQSCRSFPTDSCPRCAKSRHSDHGPLKRLSSTPHRSLSFAFGMVFLPRTRAFGGLDDIFQLERARVCAAGAAQVRITGKSWSGKRGLCVPRLGPR